MSIKTEHKWKKRFGLFILLFCMLLFVALVYSTFRDEWYNYEKQEVYQYVDCTNKDVIGIYSTVIKELGDELKNYVLVEIECIFTEKLQQVKFSFYKPGFLYDVESKQIAIIPQDNCIKFIERYRGNLKAYGGTTQSISIEDFEQINYDEIEAEGECRVVFNEKGVRIY